MAELGDISGQLLINNNHKVDTFRREFGAIMRAKGWARHARTVSALYDVAYWQADAVPARGQGRGIRKLTIGGWHGTGTRGTCRWFGDTKTFFSLYDSAVPGHKPVVDFKHGVLGAKGMTHEQLLEEHIKTMAAALEYIRKM